MDREALKLECLKHAVNTGQGLPLQLAREMFDWVTGTDEARTAPTVGELTTFDKFKPSERPAGSPPIADVVGCNGTFDPGWVQKLATDAPEPPKPRFADYTPDPSQEY